MKDNAIIDNYYTFREFHIDKNCKNSTIITKIGKYELNLYTLKLLALNRLGSQYLDDIASKMKDICYDRNEDKLGLKDEYEFSNKESSEAQA